jgi:4-amino-4-deoxy-L-arabinose transferase-like glycosyltransferase
VPTTVWLLTALHVASMLAYTVLYLPYTNPDEAQHHDLVVAWTTGDGLAEPGERFVVRGVGEGWTDSMVSFYFPPYGDDGFPPRGQRPTFEELGGSAPFDPVGFPGRGPDLPNQLTQHPPLYYAGLSVVQAVAPDGLAWDQLVGLLRFVNVALLAPLPILGWAAAKRLGAPPVAAVAAAAFPLLVPGLTRLGGAINNDNLLILLTGILTVQLLGIARGSVRTPTLVAAGVTAGLALLTKGFALAFVPAIALAVLLGGRRVGARWPWRAWAISLGTAFVAGGWWWVLNVVRFGTVQPNGYGDFPREEIYGPPAPAGLPRDLLDFVDGYIDQLSRHLVATLGLLQPPVFPFPLTMLVVVAVAIGVGAAVLRRPGRAGPPGRRSIILATVLVPLAGTAAILTQGVYAHWRTYLVWQATQGRYFYPLGVGLAAAAVAGWSGLVGRLRRWLPLGALAIGLTVQVVALRLVVDHFWAPRAAPDRSDALGDAAQAIVDRSPWPAVLTVAPFVVAVVLWVAVTVSAVRDGRRADPAA